MKREPVVAGSFYPAEPEKLRSMIDQYLENARVNIDERVLGFIVPHAGYPFSGGTAAYAFKALKGKNINLVILLGPSHHAYIQGFSVFDKGFWKTPLGEVEIAEEFTSNLKKHSDLIDYFPEGHTREHSLEVEIPFLQVVLKDFKIVPIVLSTDNINKCRVLSDALYTELMDRDDWVIIASSDLYHGYNYDETKKVTDRVNDYIKDLDCEGLLEYDCQKRSEGECAACGASAIVTMMLAAKNLGANKALFLHRTNSGDITGQRSGYIVGYGTWAFVTTNDKKVGKREEEGVYELSDNEKETLLNIVRETINEYLKNKKIPEFSVESEKLKRKSGVFVTLKKHGHLRGCIGFIRAEEPLYKAVVEMAISSATRDPRFPPLELSEVDEIRIEISVLTPFQKVMNPDEIEVGKDGLMIREGFRSGLLLPQVPVEQGWDRKTFLEHTCYKAGLPGDAWKNAELWKFQALVFSEKDI